MPRVFRCTIVTPEAEIFDQEVSYASIPAHDGQIGLAPGRAPLLVSLGHDRMRLDDTSGASHHYFISGGFAQMKDNSLAVLTTRALQPSQIDPSSAEASLKQAQEQMALSDAQVQQRQDQMDGARAMIRLAKEHGH